MSIKQTKQNQLFIIIICLLVGVIGGHLIARMNTQINPAIQTPTSLSQIIPSPAANITPIQFGKIECRSGFGGYKEREVNCVQHFKNKTHFQLKKNLECRILGDGHMTSTEGDGAASSYMNSGATNIYLNLQGDTIELYRPYLPIEKYKIIYDKDNIIQATADKPHGIDGERGFLNVSKVTGLGIRVSQHNKAEKIYNVDKDRPVQKSYIETLPFQCQ